MSDDELDLLHVEADARDDARVQYCEDTTGHEYDAERDGCGLCGAAMEAPQEPWELSLEEFRRAYPATRNYQRYDGETRAMHASSHRLGHRQREAPGEYFYTHQFAPDRAFPTHKRAVEAAHLRVVQNAIAEGRDVPMHVLSEYAEAR